MSEASSISLPDSLESLGDRSWRRTLAYALSRAPSPRHGLAAFERLLESGGDGPLLSWPVDGLEDLAVVLGSSPAMVRALVSMGKSWPRCAARYLEPAPSLAELAREIGAADAEDADELARRLRSLANLEMFRIGARDLLGLDSLRGTVRALSGLADFCLEIATRRLREFQVAEQGDLLRPDHSPVGFVVLGLGKLGAEELNYSSDIDVVYLYETDSVAPGSPPPRGFFSKLAASITRVVGEATAEGVVFRVDLRLRPEGARGAPINSVDAALSYYEGWGDTWERGALAKARAVAGELEVGERFIREVQPFIYRRHLDYLTIEDFRNMKDRIDAELASEPHDRRNVKTGFGGIRELEFVVQVLQLIHGGHDAAVRCRGTMDAIEVLREKGLLSEADAATLDEAYRFLRNVEHAVQVEERRQTQELPTTEEGLRWLARRLGYGTGRRGMAASGNEVADFERDWKRHTGNVHEAFLRFLELRRDPGEQSRRSNRQLVLLGLIADGEEERAVTRLEEMGFADGRRAALSLAQLYRGRLRGPASPQRRRAVEAMAGDLLEAVAASADPQRALDHLVEFLIRTGAHTSYLALLSGSPATMKILVELFAGSSFLAAQLVGHPELLDSLVRSDQRPALQCRADLEAALAAEIGDDADEEQVLSGLRRFKASELVRVGLNDLSATLDSDDVVAQLSLLAEVCLSATAAHARRLLGLGRDPSRGKARLCIVAMGKLGGRELGYGSDLDLIFIYAGRNKTFDSDAHAACTRLAQKILSLLQSPTRDGIVYPIDARLRPSGRSGPLVSSLERFLAYHEKEARLWERQALLRARVIYGPKTLARRVEEAVEACVYGQGLDDAEVAAIDELRAQVEDELGQRGGGELNIKTGRGGIADIESVVQMLQLKHGAENKRLRAKRATLEALQELVDSGVVPRAQGQDLARYYRFLRRVESRLRLERDRPVEELASDADGLRLIARRLGFRGSDAAAAMLAECSRVRGEVRRLYERYFPTARLRSR